MISRGRLLVHLCTEREWEIARESGARRPPSLTEVGFVHLSAPEQVHLPANRLYGDRADMLLLWVDRALLDAAVLWEPGVPGDPEAMRFPHLYGPLPSKAVTRITSYVPASDGRYPEVGQAEAGPSET